MGTLRRQRRLCRAINGRWDRPAARPQIFGQQYGVRRRQVTHRVKTGRYTHAVKGYRAWRGGRADQQYPEVTGSSTDEGRSGSNCCALLSGHLVHPKS